MSCSSVVFLICLLGVIWGVDSMCSKEQQFLMCTHHSEWPVAEVCVNSTISCAHHSIHILQFIVPNEGSCVQVEAGKACGMGCASERIKGLCDGLSRCDVAFFNRTCAKFTLKVAYACVAKTKVEEVKPGKVGESLCHDGVTKKHSSNDTRRTIRRAKRQKTVLEFNEDAIDDGYDEKKNSEEAYSYEEEGRQYGGENSDNKTYYEYEPYEDDDEKEEEEYGEYSGSYDDKNASSKQINSDNTTIYDNIESETIQNNYENNSPLNGVPPVINNVNYHPSDIDGNEIEKDTKTDIHKENANFNAYDEANSKKNKSIIKNIPSQKKKKNNSEKHKSTNNGTKVEVKNKKNQTKQPTFDESSTHQTSDPADHFSPKVVNEDGDKNDDNTVFEWQKPEKDDELDRILENDSKAETDGINGDTRREKLPDGFDYSKEVTRSSEVLKPINISEKSKTLENHKPNKHITAEENTGSHSKTRRGDKKRNYIFSDFHWALRYISDNMEKFFLYMSLALCLGLIGALSASLLHATCCGRKRPRNAQADKQQKPFDTYKTSNKGPTRNFQTLSDGEGMRDWKVPGSESSTGDDGTIEDEDYDTDDNLEVVRNSNSEAYNAAVPKNGLYNIKRGEEKRDEGSNENLIRNKKISNGSNDVNRESDLSAKLKQGLEAQKLNEQSATLQRIHYQQEQQNIPQNLIMQHIQQQQQLQQNAHMNQQYAQQLNNQQQNNEKLYHLYQSNASQTLNKHQMQKHPDKSSFEGNNEEDKIDKRRSFIDEALNEYIGKKDSDLLSVEAQLTLFKNKSAAKKRQSQTSLVADSVENEKTTNHSTPTVGKTPDTESSVVSNTGTNLSILKKHYLQQQQLYQQHTRQLQQHMQKQQQQIQQVEQQLQQQQQAIKQQEVPYRQDQLNYNQEQLRVSKDNQIHEEYIIKDTPSNISAASLPLPPLPSLPPPPLSLLNTTTTTTAAIDSIPQNTQQSNIPPYQAIDSTHNKPQATKAAATNYSSPISIAFLARQKKMNLKNQWDDITFYKENQQEGPQQQTAQEQKTQPNYQQQLQEKYQQEQIQLQQMKKQWLNEQLAAHNSNTLPYRQNYVETGDLHDHQNFQNQVLQNSYKKQAKMNDVKETLVYHPHTLSPSSKRAEQAKLNHEAYLAKNSITNGKSRSKHPADSQNNPRSKMVKSSSVTAESGLEKSTSYNINASSPSQTTHFNPAAVSDRSLEKSRRQQVHGKQNGLTNGYVPNGVPGKQADGNANEKPLVTKKFSVDAYFANIPGIPTPTSSYSPPEPYRPDPPSSQAGHPIHFSPLHLHHYYSQQKSNNTMNSQRRHFNTASIRKSSLTGSLGRAYSGHLLSLNSEEDMAMMGKISNGKNIYMSQLATAAASAREQLRLGQGVVGGAYAGRDDEVTKYRTLQSQHNY